MTLGQRPVTQALGSVVVNEVIFEVRLIELREPGFHIIATHEGAVSPVDGIVDYSIHAADGTFVGSLRQPISIPECRTWETVTIDVPIKIREFVELTE